MTGKMLAVVSAFALTAPVIGPLALLGIVAICSQAPATATRQCTHTITLVAFPAATVSLLGLALTCTVWIVGLVATAQLHSWRWFISILVFSPVATLVYGWTTRNR